MEEARKIFGKRVRTARKDLTWSQDELARRFGCDQKTISNIERGKGIVDVSDLPRLAQILRKDLIYFYPTQAEILDPELLPPDVAEVVYRIQQHNHPIRERLLNSINALLDTCDTVEEEMTRVKIIGGEE